MAHQTRRDVFQAIADPTRRDILNMIAHKSLNLNSIANQFDMSRPAISQHIKILAECGLIMIKDQGRERFCQVQAQKLSEVADWIEPFRKLWEHRHNNLDDLLDKLQRKKKIK
ncbi:MAG TPA: metalloregulator ArsR/SmtB family transcription factor [Chryseolinea sp.]|nr:metalloregulator ArsR/SmtB family transcription factor [Chryseolinea sp.]